MHCRGHPWNTFSWIFNGTLLRGDLVPAYETEVKEPFMLNFIIKHSANNPNVLQRLV